VRDLSKYVTENEVADLTSLSVQRLRNDRFQQKGIPYVKIGRSVRYNLEDVVNFMESRKIQTSQC